MTRCDFRTFSECDCPAGTCQQQTYTTRTAQITADQNAEWRAYNRALFSTVYFTTLCVVTGCLLMFAAVKMERQERISNLINQESHNG
ncbi:hypothetical protein [Rhizobium rhizogenes]|uniref:hypothetical protein n=1 Tax=Rhizobium rhizogenes TaxID=359 RepID=UPI0004D89C15|nr:hypothetical protein [Rhizobium rhizogenes]KEA07162.1 hypothetical protein CN09_09495 [Rhizobium rhizogenes]NTI80398.1 hypothetical protein [Rhizobium rhizogenes]NTJ22584.1 hypothetical protein [Rhizobium rhizogenes]QUE81290.1 hypothetical protein EML492_05640 [Rhizobium rhizogenes]TQO80611.1 hypothetical protein FFE80_05780 [Rhizobium rhizogenes]